MITEMRIGQAMHKPNGEILYPVYFRNNEYTKTRTIYVPKEVYLDLKNKLEFLYLSIEKNIRTGVVVE